MHTAQIKINEWRRCEEWAEGEQKKNQKKKRKTNATQKISKNDVWHHVCHVVIYNSVNRDFNIKENVFVCWFCRIAEAHTAHTLALVRAPHKAIICKSKAIFLLIVCALLWLPFLRNSRLLVVFAHTHTHSHSIQNKLPIPINHNVSNAEHKKWLHRKISYINGIVGYSYIAKRIMTASNNHK